MATVTGQATTFNLPNFVGEIFGLSPLDTPFLSMIGGLTGGSSIRTKRFANQTYDLPAVAIPAHLEGQDAPTATEVDRQQFYNIAQIFHEQVNISYTKQAATDEVSGVSILGNQPVTDELSFQTLRKLEKLARDIENAFINGTFAEPGDNATARKTRGILAATTTNVTAVGGALTKSAVDTLLKTMWDNGSPLNSDNTIMLVNSAQKLKLSGLYGIAPESRNVGGVNINSLETDFGTFGVVLDRYVPQTVLAIVDLSVCAPAFLEIPNKGFLFREELAKTGASEKHQIYGEIGLQHGPEKFHGKLTGLT